MGRQFFVWWSGAPLGNLNEGEASPENILGNSRCEDPEEGRAGPLRNSRNPVTRFGWAGAGVVGVKSGVSRRQPARDDIQSVAGNHWWLCAGK